MELHVAVWSHVEPFGAVWSVWSRVERLERVEPCGAVWSCVKRVEPVEKLESYTPQSCMEPYK